MYCSVRDCCWFVFFFKQKTAYEMRISDLSSDVCSSDLIFQLHRKKTELVLRSGWGATSVEKMLAAIEERRSSPLNRMLYCLGIHQVGRTACKDRSEEHTSELQSLMRISYAVFCLKKKKNRSK